MSDLAVCCDVGGVCVSSVSTLGRAAAAISVSVSARREINGPLCGGGASAGGARVEMGERGVCRGISLLYQCFSSLFCSPLRGELAILLLQRNINKIFTRLWLFIYSLSGLVTQARAGCCDREESVTTPTSISGTGSLGSRTAAGL